MRVTDINTSTIEGKIEVMQRAAKGEKLVVKNRVLPEWVKIDSPDASWNWGPCDYQIILAEPRELWLYKDNEERRYSIGTKPPILLWDEVIHVREVLPE